MTKQYMSQSQPDIKICAYSAGVHVYSVCLLCRCSLCLTAVGAWPAVVGPLSLIIARSGGK